MRFLCRFPGLAVAACTGLIAAGGASCLAQVVDTLDRSFTVQGRPTIWARNGDGRIRIAADSQPQVRVKATKEVRHASNQEEARRLADRVQVRIEQSGNRIEAEAKYPSHVRVFFGNEPQVLVHFEITTPKASDVDAHAGDGSLEVLGLDGQISVSTGDGELTADNCSGRITAETGDGKLQIESVRGDVTARTGDGGMTLDGVFQGLDAKSGDGSIHITVRAGSKMEREWSIHSGDGGVHLTLPGSFSADLDASSGDGHIDSEFPITVEKTTSKNHLMGRLNSGGYRLRVQTGDGSINIRRN